MSLRVFWDLKKNQPYIFFTIHSFMSKLVSNVTKTFCGIPWLHKHTVSWLLLITIKKFLITFPVTTRKTVLSIQSGFEIVSWKSTSFEYQNNLIKVKKRLFVWNCVVHFSSVVEFLWLSFLYIFSISMIWLITPAQTSF